MDTIAKLAYLVWSYLLLSAEKAHICPCVRHNMFILIRLLWNLQILNRAGINYWTSLEFGQIRLSASGLFALEG